MEQFTFDELRNIGVLIQKSQITGQEATLVALLLQKINRLLENPPKTEVKKDEPK